MEGVTLMHSPAQPCVNKRHCCHRCEHGKRNVVRKERKGATPVPFPPHSLQIALERPQQHHVEPQVQQLEVCSGRQQPPPPLVLDRDAMLLQTDRQWIDAAIPVVGGQSDVEEEEQCRAWFVTDEPEVLVLPGILHPMMPAANGQDRGHGWIRRGADNIQEQRWMCLCPLGVIQPPYPAGGVPGPQGWRNTIEHDIPPLRSNRGG